MENIEKFYENTKNAMSHCNVKRVIENKFVSRLKRAEEQIKNGEITDGDTVLAKIRKEYRYK